MSKRDYTEFDQAILDRIKRGGARFDDLLKDETIRGMSAGIWHGEGNGDRMYDVWRPIDRRLQYLRKKFRIISVKGKGGPVWKIIEE